jgi:ABC-type multidrug transport system ATPase subunit
MTNTVFESIVKIFAVIAKSDGIIQTELIGFDRFLESQFDKSKSENYKKMFNSFSKTIKGNEEEMRLYAKEASQELDTNQRLLIYVRICEIVKQDGKKTENETKLLKVLSGVFNLEKTFTKIIESFVFVEDEELLKFDDVGFIKEGYVFIKSSPRPIAIPFNTDSKIAFAFIKEMGFFLLRVLYTKEDIYFNNQILTVGNTFFFYPGSAIMTMNLEPVHGVFMGLVVFGEIENNGSQLNFSKLWQVVKSTQNENKFICENLCYNHPNGVRGLIDFNFESQSGDLIALMGSSGSGKSTLLNILNGNYRPSSGRVLFNGINIHEEYDFVRPYFGYVPQDDLLIEDLTVFENLYFSARLSIPKATKSQIAKKCILVLKEVGLYEVKDIKVGNSLSKTISGGQRKRLNICLELIRNPQVLFMDEPTSGLSSRDSENIMKLLRKLSFKGTLIFVVIHQPSSTIYKLFDQLILLDTGGFPIYTGDPVEAISYFKRCINHITSNVTTCPACGNINPEIIFDIVENKNIDEKGEPTNERKTTPKTWFRRFLITKNETKASDFEYKKPDLIKNKNIFHQYLVFFRRDLLSKLYNTQFLLITLLEPLILSLLLSFVVRYQPFSKNISEIYLFSNNDNVPAFIFISIIVSIFMGLSLSAEEIFKDQKIQKREEFLSLSRFSYLGSKVSIQFIISFLQTIIFLLPASLIIGNVDMFLYYFLILFSCASFGNMLSLNISSSFKDIGTIYILIPILLIPQLILGGIIITYDKMNPIITNKDKVPVIADMVASRWAYEAACVVQFRDNSYNKVFYEIDKEISKYNYRSLYWIPFMENEANDIQRLFSQTSDSSFTLAHDKLLIVRNEIIKQNNDKNGWNDFNKNLLEDRNINSKVLEDLKTHILYLERKMNEKLIGLRKQRDLMETKITDKNGYKFLEDLQSQNQNKALEKLVLKRDASDRIMEGDGELVQLMDPVFNDVYSQKYNMDCRSPFYSPKKYLFGIRIDTFWFNLGVIWAMCGGLFVSLHFNLLRKLLSHKIFRK